MPFLMTKLYTIFKVMDWASTPWWWLAIFALVEIWEHFQMPMFSFGRKA